jgi:hypothetical protein
MCDVVQTSSEVNSEQWTVDSGFLCATHSFLVISGQGFLAFFARWFLGRLTPLPSCACFALFGFRLCLKWTASLFKAGALKWTVDSGQGTVDSAEIPTPLACFITHSDRLRMS